jgi:hypothetical protein
VQARHTAIAAVSGWLILCVVAAVTMLRMSPPPPSPVDAAPETFSAGRARIHLEAIAREPHPTGSEAARQVEQYIFRYLTLLGLRVEIQELPSCTTLAELRRCANVRNVVATFPGRASDAALLLSAHYDTVPNSPGAADDGAAVAALLETARALTVLGTRAHDVIFAFVDAEEELLLGAAALAKSARFSTVRVAANFEARGSRGASALFAVSSDSAPIIERVTPIFDRPIMNSFFSTVASLLPNGTDAEVYDRYGVKTLSFAFVEGVEHYHQGTDTPSHLDMGSLEHHGRYALALAKYVADMDLAALTRQGGDDVFFDVGGWFVVRYPFWAARSLAVILIALLARTCWQQTRDGRATLAAIATCAGIFVAFLGAAAVTTTFVHRMMTMGWSPWGPFVHAGALAASIGCLVLAAFVRLMAWQCRRWGQRATMLGPLLIGAALAVATSAFAPGASHVFLWPTAGATLMVLISPAASPGRVLAMLALLVPAAILQAQVLYTVIAVVGGSAIAVPMLCLGLWLGLTAPGIILLIERAPYLWRGVAIAGAAAVVVVGVVGRGSATAATGNCIAYAVDQEERKAFWASADREQDAWTRQVLGASPERARLPSFSSLTPIYFQSAPFTDVPEPTLVVDSDNTNGDQRELTLRVRSQRGARTIVVWETTGAHFGPWTFEGASPLPLVRISPELDAKGFRFLTGMGYDARFTVAMFAVPAAGAALRLVTNAKGALEFRVMDVSDDLALLPAEFRARSAEWTAGYPGDQTWVSGHPLHGPASSDAH